ncbi:MAG: MBL fold metallo-hydrolase [Thermoplasmatales archaeon]|nr:MBL fold metallo-hydrolase [Thermoplasmatales archaeon]
MKICCIYGYNFDSNIYIIDGEIPTIIDCGTGLYNEDVIKKINKIIDITSIKQIIITHEHYDHCGGVKKLFEIIGGKPKIIAHIKTSVKIEKGDSDFQFLYTPGHSPGSICLYDQKTRSLFSGDTVFSYGSFGRYDFPGGSCSLLKNSIEKLALLDIKKLYPGHDLLIEKNGNTHMKMTLRNIKNLI